MHIMVYIVCLFFFFGHLFKASLCRTKIIKLNLHLLRVISMTMSSSHSHLQRGREEKRKEKEGPIYKSTYDTNPRFGLAKGVSTLQSPHLRKAS